MNFISMKDDSSDEMMEGLELQEDEPVMEELILDGKLPAADFKLV